MILANCSCFENEERQDGGQELRDVLWERKMWVRISYISGVQRTPEMEIKDQEACVSSFNKSYS